MCIHTIAFEVLIRCLTERAENMPLWVKFSTDKIEDEIHPLTPTKPVVFAEWVAGMRPADPQTINKHVHDINETSSCKWFTVFVTKYKLMSKDNLIVQLEGQQSLQPDNEA
ncbi:hypothetical protein DPMN_166816 [Dreissena polymorpha]|uniref:Uncharacterized protein n=1 Tax=Dreissena polymorpha TaxID=45954 RepID=A0A9D4EZP5_DREPO|nr:hypothetical protein DPMN_166816 [Dreissena polymorpha]